MKRITGRVFNFSLSNSKTLFSVYPAVFFFSSTCSLQPLPRHFCFFFLCVCPLHPQKRCWHLFLLSYFQPQFPLLPCPVCETEKERERQNDQLHFSQKEGGRDTSLFVNPPFPLRPPPTHAIDSFHPSSTRSSPTDLACTIHLNRLTPPGK